MASPLFHNPQNRLAQPFQPFAYINNISSSPVLGGFLGDII
jgi:hypothetical protein